MLKFIKMKQHEGYLLYYSVFFVVIVVLTVVKKYSTNWSQRWKKKFENSSGFVTGKFIDFPVCVIRYIFIRKLLHLTISSPFISINQKHA